MKFKDLELYIYSAIENQYCTLSQITKFVDKEYVLGDILDTYIKDLLDAMVLDEKLVLASNGTATAYFVKDNIPARWSLGGDGRLALIWEGNPSYTIEPPPVLSDEDHIFSYEKEIYVFTGFTDKDYFDMEFHAGNGLNSSQIADEMKIPRAVFNHQEDVDPKLINALENGRNSLYLKNAEKVIHQCAESGFTASECAAALKTTVEKFDLLLEKVPALKEAWEKGAKTSRKDQVEEIAKPKRKLLPNAKKCGCGRSKLATATKCGDCWRKERREGGTSRNYQTVNGSGRQTLLGKIDALEQDREDIDIRTEIDARNEVQEKVVADYRIKRDEFQQYQPEKSNVFPVDFKDIAENAGHLKPFVIDGNKLLKIALMSLYSENAQGAFVEQLLKEFLNQMKEQKNG